MRKKRPEGRPTKYNPKFPKALLDYYDIEPYREVEISHRGKDGKEWTSYEERANDFPSLIGFARKMKVSYEAVYDWGKKYPEFGHALSQCKLIAEQMLMTNTLKGLYNPSFAIFTAKNKFGWRDEQYIQNESKHIIFIANDDRKVLDSNGSINRLTDEKVSLLDTIPSVNEAHSINAVPVPSTASEHDSDYKTLKS